VIKGEQRNTHYEMFIDILYAVVVGEMIFTYGRELFDPLTIPTLAMVIVYIAIISSWLFWHRAISRYPHKNPSRFFIDIIVLVTYLLMMLDHSNPDTVFLGFVILYLLFLVWDLLTRIEYGAGAGRLTSSSISLVLVLFIAIIRHLLLNFTQISSTILNSIFLFLLIAMIVISQEKDIARVSHKS